jgi:hypothetical protein
LFGSATFLILKTVGLMHEHGILIAILQYDVHVPHSADDPHAAVYDNVRFENGNVAGLECAEDLVNEFSGWLNTFRGKRRDVKPQSV